MSKLKTSREQKSRAIQGKVLTHTQRQNLASRMVVKTDYERIVFDGRLLDALQTIVPSDVFRVVHDSKMKCTKQFYHKDAMMETVKLFITRGVADGRYKKVVRAARVLLEKMLPKANLVPVDCRKAFDDIVTNKNGAAGAIATGSKFANRELCIETAMRIKQLISEGVTFKEISVPAMDYHRAQISNLVDERGEFNPNFKEKDRLVLGLDGGTVLVEGEIGYPIYCLLKSKFTAYAGGKEYDQQIKTMERWHNHHHWISTDFSKFDMNVPDWAIYCVFDMLKDMYIPESYHRQMDWVAWNFVNTQMLCPDGEIRFKVKGIPSGSYFTQIIGTLVNLLMQLSGLACYVKTHFVGEPGVKDLVEKVEALISEKGVYMISAMGDDSIMFLSTGNTDTEGIATSMSQSIEKIFGVKANIDKRDRGNSVQAPSYLKRTWYPEGCYTEPKELLINVVHMERDRSYDGYSPWHIIYGLKVTYSLAFPGVSEEFLVQQMNKSGGLKAILEIPYGDLPGVLRGLGENGRQYLYDRALKISESMQAEPLSA